jgi:hypothetical protein
MVEYPGRHLRKYLILAADDGCEAFRPLFVATQSARMGFRGNLTAAFESFAFFRWNLRKKCAVA